MNTVTWADVKKTADFASHVSRYGVAEREKQSMNAIVALCHFCEAHGPCILFCTQVRRVEDLLLL